MKNCEACGIEFKGRTDARFCSTNCRVTFSRKQSLVTDNVTFSESAVTDNLYFSFTVTYKPLSDFQPAVAEERKKVRKAKYWYDVPLNAIPELKKGWVKMPEYMNGRQYFLWWKNEFRVNDKGEAVIHNPFRVLDKVEYVSAGEGSRRWGS